MVNEYCNEVTILIDLQQQNEKTKLNMYVHNKSNCSVHKIIELQTTNV